MDGSGPSSSETSAAVSESPSGARAIVCVPCTRVSAPSYSGREVIEHQRGRLRDHREEVGQHRLADLIDPVGILDDDTSPGFLGPTMRRSPGRSTAADAHPDRLPVKEHSGRRCPAESSSSSKSSGFASLTRSRTRSRASCPSRPSTPVAARSSRATAWKGTWLVCDSQKAVNTSTPRRSPVAATSRTKRLLPMPGDPATPTTAPWPSMARSNKPSTAAISHRLPTRFDSARPMPRCCSRMPNSRWATTGSSAPLICTSSG